MEFILQALPYIAVLIGGGGVVKLYEIYRKSNRDDDEFIRDRYRKLIDDLNREHEAELLRAYRKYEEFRTEYEQFKQSIADNEKAVEND